MLMLAIKDVDYRMLHMERDRAQVEADPILRWLFIEQESLDEYIDRLHPGLDTPDFEEYCASEGVDPERLRDHVENEWSNTLDRQTNYNEWLYLKGLTDKTQRWAAIDQGHAAIRNAAVEKGTIAIEDTEAVGEIELPDF